MTVISILSPLALRYKGKAVPVENLSVRIILVNTKAEEYLTPMEKEVLEELANGFCPKIIAANNFVELCTIRTHINHLHEKTHAHDLPALLNHRWHNQWFEVRGFKREE